MSLDFIKDFALRLEVSSNLLNDNLSAFSVIQGNGHAIAYQNGCCISYIYPDSEINPKSYYTVCTVDTIYPDDKGDQIASFNSLANAREYATELMSSIMGPGEDTIKIYKCTTTCNDCDEKHWNCDQKSVLKSEFNGCPYEGPDTSFIEYCSGGDNILHYYDQEVLESRYKGDYESF